MTGQYLVWALRSSIAAMVAGLGRIAAQTGDVGDSIKCPFQGCRQEQRITKDAGQAKVRVKVHFHQQYLVRLCGCHRLFFSDDSIQCHRRSAAGGELCPNSLKQSTEGKPVIILTDEVGYPFASQWVYDQYNMRPVGEVTFPQKDPFKKSYTSASLSTAKTHFFPTESEYGEEDFDKSTTVSDIETDDESLYSTALGKGSGEYKSTPKIKIKPPRSAYNITAASRY